MQTGFADLPLHPGKCPPWLFGRMKELGTQICGLVVEEYSQRELLGRLSNPFFFQSLGCVLGFDWHSSGVTTTVCGALKEGLNSSDIGVFFCGGKGSASKNAPKEIQYFSNSLNFSERKSSELESASKLCAKIDSAAVQDSFQLYHHCFVFSEKGEWAVIQQGLNDSSGYARRYHWLGENVEDFCVEPHSAICSDKKQQTVLNLASKDSKENKDCSLDLVKENPQKLKKHFFSIQSSAQKNLWNWCSKEIPQYLHMPRKVNWTAIELAHNLQPQNFEELLSVQGIGTATVRALSLVSELVYGSKASWEDPCKYSFAHGGKDGVPYFVNQKKYDETISFLEEALKQTTLESWEKSQALKRLCSKTNALEYRKH